MLSRLSRPRCTSLLLPRVLWLPRVCSCAYEMLAWGQVKEALGVSVLAGVGSTPTCSHPPTHLDGVDEMHPGVCEPKQSLEACFNV